MGRKTSRTMSVEAKNKKEAIEKLRAKMFPKYRKILVPVKTKLVRTRKEYEVTWRPRKKKERKRRKK